MKKEIIWNGSLFIFGIFLVVLLSIDTSGTSNLNKEIGWDSTYFGILGKWQFGLLTGLTLILFRYLNIAILKIQNYDLKLLVLIFSYFLPILFVLILVNYTTNSFRSNLRDQTLPIEAIQLEVKKLRDIGFFKKNETEDFENITNQVIGSFLRKQDGRVDLNELYDESDELKFDQLLGLDNQKVLNVYDTDWVVQGNHAYGDFIKQLAQRSEGNIVVEYIKEEWLSTDKIKISFQIDNMTHEIFPIVNKRLADIKSILIYFNNHLKKKNKDFQYHYVAGETNLIIGLSKSEKDKVLRNYQLDIEKLLK